MCNVHRLLVALFLILPSTGAYADTPESTRVADPKQHASTGGGSYPYREKSDYVLRELDLKPGDVVVDIGAGDGWWAEKMAPCVGPEGTVHAGEVDQKKVDKMKERFADVPAVKPYLCPTDGTGLPENSCDLAFLSKTYHHLSDDGRVDYWRHLREVVRPTGRVCVIERHPGLAADEQGKKHGWSPGLLLQQAEEAGWIAVRYELITGTYHFLAIFVQKDLFPPEPKPEKKPAADAPTETP
ncbi:MAG: methyltransferase domain-containing protein [Planctomycetota bacterium]